MAKSKDEFSREEFLQKPLPSSPESEKVILGAILLDNSLITQAVELKPEDFYSPLHRRVHTAMLALFEREERIDPVLLGEELKKTESLDSIGGIAVITNLTFGLPHFTDISDYIKIVKNKAMLRNVVRSCNQITTEALAEEDDAEVVLEHAEKLIYDLRDFSSKEETAMLGDILKRTLEVRVQRAKDGDSGITGISTGFKEFDQMTSGLKKKEMIVVAARPSMGKTSWALDMARNITKADNEAVVVIFSLESSQDLLGDKLLCQEAKVDSLRYLHGTIVDQEWKRIADAAQELQNRKIIIIDVSDLSVLEMKARARKIAYEHKRLDLIIGDYLQLMKGDGKTESRYQEISQVSRNLKRLAKDLNVPVIAINSLSRECEKRKPPIPVMSDINESGKIEFDADIIAFIYREEQYNKTEANKGIAEIIIAKNKNGPTGRFKLTFLSQYSTFENYYEKF